MANFKLYLYVLVIILGVEYNLGAVSALQNDMIEVKTDRKSAKYKCGEKVEFTITVKRQGKLLKTGKANVKLLVNGLRCSFKEDFDLRVHNPIKITSTMESPGFLRCRSYITRKGKYGFGAAVFSPEKIKRIAPLPADFMTFWENGKRKLDKIPLSVKLTKLDKYCREKFDCYKISFANIDNSRIYGFISIPKQKGKHPAVITVPPAGFGFTSPELRLAARGVIVLRMNVHNFDPGLPVSELRKFYKELNKNKHYGLHGAPKAEKYYFYRAFLGINRAVDWLCARPDWDRKHLVATGTSQGGGSVLIMAGLNKHITAVAAIVPAFCDLMGFRAGRFPGWPRLAYQKDRKKEYDKMIPYFDAANFASFIKCPVLICVGFLDMTCPASSVFAAYNVIKSPKEIIEQPRIGHSQGGKGYSKYISKWIDAHLGLVDKKSELQI